MSKKTSYTADQKALLDSRYRALRYNLDYIANQLDRTSALYPMMARVVYEDFETLIATTIEDARPANDG